MKKILTLLILVLLSACTKQTGLDDTYFVQRSYSQQQYTQPAAYYLQQANTAATTAEKQAWQLKAAGRLLQDGIYGRAGQLLKGLAKQRLTSELQAEKNLLSARLTLIKKRPQNALKLLAQIDNPTVLPTAQQISFYQILATAYSHDGNVLESAKAHIKLNPLLPEDGAKQQNSRDIWKNLEKLSQQDLYALLLEDPNTQLRGWLRLVYITKQQHGSQQLVQAINAWQRNYPNHPGNYLLPQIGKQTITTTNQIALLLPLQGKLAEPGQAVRNGFMAAYYQANKKQQAKSKVRIYDTSNVKNINKLYQTALADGADFVIGPLNKQKVKKLSKRGDFPVPTLALNYTDNRRQAANFYQFGLSPQDEAYQTALKAWHDGHRRAVIVAPRNNWGQGIAQAFRNQWQMLGGEVITELAYLPSEDLNPAIKQLLGIDASVTRQKQLRSALRQKIKFTPRRRQDTDMVFMVASPAMARQIQPLFNYYYAGDLPIYATSLVYEAAPMPKRDRDMNGIVFCDMPWVFKQGAQIQRQHNQTATPWPDSFNRYTRLYALGMDAYLLTTQLNRLTLFPEFALNGATGKLTLSNQQQIQRSLQWAQFKSGIPELKST